MSEPIHHSIRGGGYRAEVSGTGAALLALDYDVSSDTRESAARGSAARGSAGAYRLVETPPGHEPPQDYVGAVLAPWPGGIRDGHFYFDGIEHQLALTDPERGTAVNGLAWHRRWEVTALTDSRIQHTLEVGLHKGWPYQLRLTVAHEVGPHGLTVTHTATNVGGYHSPFGLGVCPYLRAGDTPLDECTLQLAAGTRMPLDRARGLPDAYSQSVADTEYDFTRARLLGDVHLDVPFSALDEDLDGNARHRLCGPDGRGAELWTGRGFGWLQATTIEDAGTRALALAPMTCPPDAFNLGIDLLVLQSGERWSGRWGLRAYDSQG
ncbi:MAG TPA: aldose 1-epimerase family protein [Rhodococcus sp. (in: high G+C Gram-positive bacteria)]|nr:aldose 1-epimerase family protein [Rhodococcus sp. (in: high G+C Gram-positive bacteria)]